MSSVVRKIQAGAASLALAGAGALVAPGVASAQNPDGAWAAGCAAPTAFNFCDASVNTMAMPMNMMMLTFADPVTGDATFRTGALMMNALGPVMADGVDSFAAWLMGDDQEVTFGTGGGSPQVTFFLSSYRGAGMTISPTT